MPARGGIHHLDIAVADPARSIAFYLDLLGPLGWRETIRYPTYRGSEDVVYLGPGMPAFGIRQADGGAHEYYHVGVEHFASKSTSAPRSRKRTIGASHAEPRSTSRPRTTATSPATTRSSSSIPTASASKCSAGIALDSS